jgi:lysyl-tRNA synthetase class 2
MRDTIRIFRAACRAVTGDERVTYQGVVYDLAETWEELTMAQAFYRYAGIGSWDYEELLEALEDSGQKVKRGSTVQDLFFKLYLEKVEPALGIERPLIVRDYPDFLGTMARSRPDDPGTLERFEVYIGGMELANGYSELTDPVKLEERMTAVLDELAEEGVRGLTVDGEFLEAVKNLPPCAGVSVGMDRLSMLLMDADDISQVVFPFEEETT